MGEPSAGFRQKGVKIREAFVVDVAGVLCDVELGAELSGRTFCDRKEPDELLVRLPFESFGDVG